MEIHIKKVGQKEKSVSISCGTSYILLRTQVCSAYGEGIRNSMLPINVSFHVDFSIFNQPNSLQSIIVPSRMNLV